MRRVLVFASIAALALSACVGVAQAQTTTTVAKLGFHDCGTKKLTFLFWPQGHGAIAQYAFPAFATPHLEVYDGTTTTYASPDFRAYTDSQGNISFTSACTAVQNNSEILPVQSKKKLTKAAVLACAFSKAPLVNMIVGGTMSVSSGNHVAALIEMTPTSSSITYNSKDCKAKPPLS